MQLEDYLVRKFGVHNQRTTEREDEERFFFKCQRQINKREDYTASMLSKRDRIDI